MSRHHPAVIGAVALGGAIGALLRWLLDQWLLAGWPWPTLTVNLLGSLALGVLTVVAARFAVPGWVRPGIGTGLLGGFTTFSAYVVQVHLLAGAEGSSSPGGVAAAGAYLLLTPLLCVGAAGLAMTGTERMLHTDLLFGGHVPDDPDRTLG